MNPQEKEVRYTAANTYSTLNSLHETTENIWLVFHGLGYLSRYFINYFKGLDPNKNYIIAPQAPSKYYQDKTFTYVGASWLTKENTLFETQNLIRYVNQVVENESLHDLKNQNLILLGYSQGVSVMLRWLAQSSLAVSQVILHSGGIPRELTPDHFAHLHPHTPVHLLYGTEDPYIHSERVVQEKQLATTLFGERLTIIPFPGGHEVNTQLINQLASPNAP